MAWSNKTIGVRTRGKKLYRDFLARDRRWHRSFFFEVVREELHATKGWRQLGPAVRKFVDKRTWLKYPAAENRYERARPIIGRTQELISDRPSNIRKLQRSPILLLQPDERARKRHIHPRSQRT